MVQLVAYDLKTPNDTPENYEKIIGAIKSSFNSWCRLEQSVWLVDTHLEAAPVREALKPFLHAGDVLFVARLQRGWASWNFGDERNNWIKARQF
jgi:hypothetical protein